MFYWNEIINDLAKIFTWFCSACFLSLYDEVTNVLLVSLLSHDRYQYDSLILSSDTGGFKELLLLHKQPVSWNFFLQS